MKTKAAGQLCCGLMLMTILMPLAAASNGTDKFKEVKDLGGLKLSIEQSCPKSKQTGLEGAFESILSAIAPKAFSRAATALGNAIKKFAGVGDEARTLTANNSSFFYSIDTETGDRKRSPVFACLVIEKSGVDGSYTSNPAIYMEATVNLSPDRTAFRLKPVYLLYGEHLNPNGNKKEARSIVVSFTFSTPDGKTFAAVTMPIGKLALRTKLLETTLATAVSPWMPLRPISESEEIPRLTYEELLKVKVDDKDPVAAANLDSQRHRLLRLLAGHGPVNVTANVTETRSINQFLAAIGELVAGSEKDVAAAVTAALDTTVQEKAELDNAVSQLEAMQAYKAAMSTVIEMTDLVNKLESAEKPNVSEINKARSAVEQAKYSANIAALKAGIRPVPFVL